MTTSIAFAITALADDPAALDDTRLAAIAHALAGRGAAVGAPIRLAAAAIELPAIVEVTGEVRAAAGELRRLVLTAAGAGIDIAVRADTPERRAPRLVVFDMDSTLIQLETIDELARLHGVGPEVSDVTRRAMLGELDFESSLRYRVALLAGMPDEALAELAGRLPIMPGAPALVRALRALGCRTAVVSGGFTFGTAAVQRTLGLDDAFANQLERVDRRLTGRLIDPVVTPERKAALLAQIAAAHGIAPAATVAVGDGANDLPMLARAGFGVAFHAKPKVAATADTAISSGGLDRLLHLFGLSSDDIARLG